MIDDYYWEDPYNDCEQASEFVTVRIETTNRDNWCGYKLRDEEVEDLGEDGKIYYFTTDVHIEYGYRNSDDREDFRRGEVSELIRKTDKYWEDYEILDWDDVDCESEKVYSNWRRIREARAERDRAKAERENKPSQAL